MTITIPFSHLKFLHTPMVFNKNIKGKNTMNVRTEIYRYPHKALSVFASQAFRKTPLQHGKK